MPNQAGHQPNGGARPCSDPCVSLMPSGEKRRFCGATDAAGSWSRSVWAGSSRSAFDWSIRHWPRSFVRTSGSGSARPGSYSRCCGQHTPSGTSQAAFSATGSARVASSWQAPSSPASPSSSLRCRCRSGCCFWERSRSVSRRHCSGRPDSPSSPAFTTSERVQRSGSRWLPGAPATPFSRWWQRSSQAR